MNKDFFLKIMEGVATLFLPPISNQFSGDAWKGDVVLLCND